MIKMGKENAMVFNTNIKDMIKKYPNDYELGNEYRKYCLTNGGDLNEYCLQHPNDYELGNFIRKTFNYYK